MGAYWDSRIVLKNEIFSILSYFMLACLESSQKVLLWPKVYFFFEKLIVRMKRRRIFCWYQIWWKLCNKMLLIKTVRNLWCFFNPLRGGKGPQGPSLFKCFLTQQAVKLKIWKKYVFLRKFISYNIAKLSFLIKSVYIPFFGYFGTLL